MTRLRGNFGFCEDDDHDNSGFDPVDAGDLKAARLMDPRPCCGFNWR
jgi:hypothetical protein